MLLISSYRIVATCLILLIKQSPFKAHLALFLQLHLSIQLSCFSFKSKVKLATLIKGDLKAPFSIATTPTCKGGRYSFPWIVQLTLDHYLILLSVKLGGIKYHILSLWSDSTCTHWTQVAWAIGKHSWNYALFGFFV